MRGTEGYTPMFLWFGLALFFLVIAVPLLFALWPYVGPFGMLASFLSSYICIFAGTATGHRILNR